MGVLSDTQVVGRRLRYKTLIWPGGWAREQLRESPAQATIEIAAQRHDLAGPLLAEVFG